jgi:glycosyltransferase involved in cell wall biosynthesis
MRIFQAAPYYPPHMGGVEFHVEGLSEGLKRRGHEVFVASSCGEGSGLIRVPCLNFPYSPVPLSFPGLEADIYHSHVPTPTFAFRLREARPHVVTYHNDVVIPSKINGLGIPRSAGTAIERMNRRLLLPVLDRAEIVVATTRSYAETSAVLGSYLDKIRIVPNAVDASLYPSRSKRSAYVIYIGRLEEYKGIGMLLEAMREVEMKTDLGLVVVGDGCDRRRFQERAARLGLRVEFTGRVERSRLIDLLSRAEMLVLPSPLRLEAFGIVLLEAMACQTPVLAFDTPGVSEVAREGGHVFSDAGELAHLIAELHTDEPRREALGRRGRRAVEERYSWTRVLNEMESIYSEIA